jgi:hypothetical protein
MPATPINKKLYAEVIADAKKRFKVWPSAYASGWVVRRYKELGGAYKSPQKEKKKTTTLDRWFRQEWINVCELPKIVPCGRSKASMKDYPYCRPLKRITKDTPKTARELTPKQIAGRCEKKKQDPTKRVLGQK